MFGAHYIMGSVLLALCADKYKHPKRREGLRCGLSSQVTPGFLSELFMQRWGASSLEAEARIRAAWTKYEQQAQWLRFRAVLQ